MISRVILPLHAAQVLTPDEERQFALGQSLYEIGQCDGNLAHRGNPDVLLELLTISFDRRIVAGHAARLPEVDCRLVQYGVASDEGEVHASYHFPDNAASVGARHCCCRIDVAHLGAPLFNAVDGIARADRCRVHANFLQDCPPRHLSGHCGVQHDGVAVEKLRLQRLRCWHLVALTFPEVLEVLFENAPVTQGDDLAVESSTHIADEATALEVALPPITWAELA
mmetsp:Transcript_107480/g.239977  ORF Transcript_107480/g.239977 Transcript_107480/m.239977 type:complete len:225 (-) Transcript_107480:426-1100(-)